MKKSDEVRAAIVGSAETLFQKWGIRKTTMEDIARQARIGKSTLYYYYGGKEEILEAVAVAQGTRIMDIVRKEMETKATAKEKLLAYVYTTFREFRDAITLFETARGEITGNKALLDRVMRRFDDADARMLESILDLGIRRGEFKTIGPREVRPAVQALQTVRRSLAINLFVDSGNKKLIDLIIKLMAEGM